MRICFSLGSRLSKTHSRKESQIPPTRFHDQQRSFARAKLDIFTTPTSRSPSKTVQSGQVADISPARIELRPLLARKLQFATSNSLRV